VATSFWIIKLSVPYLGSNCLELEKVSAAAAQAVRLSVPYLGSNCLEQQVVQREPGTGWAFSTLPRVELPGALGANRGVGRGVLYFQYPTSGRTAWSRKTRVG